MCNTYFNRFVKNYLITWLFLFVWSERFNNTDLPWISVFYGQVVGKQCRGPEAEIGPHTLQAPVCRSKIKERASERQDNLAVCLFLSQ